MAILALPQSQFIKHGRLEALSRIRARLHLGPARTLSVIGAILLLVCLKKLNTLANRLALNRWRWKSDRQQWSWHSEVAVVTGGCSGIGLLIVKGLLEKEMKVAVLDMQEPPEEIRTRIQLHKIDISDSTAVGTAADEIRSTLGNPTILVNNAGIGMPGDLFEEKPEATRKLFAVNLLSHWYTIQQFVPHMASIDKGHIVSIASMASFGTVANHIGYACSKVGVLALHEGLTSLLSTRYNAPRVHTTVVHPSFVRTPLVKHVSPESMKNFLEAHEVADPILEHIFTCRSGQLILPGTFSWVSMLRGLPHWYQIPFRDRLAKLAFAL